MNIITHVNKKVKFSISSNECRTTSSTECSTASSTECS